MKDLKIYLFIASVLLIFYLIGQYNRPVPINWSQTLKNDEKIPFGTYIIYQRLTDIFPQANVVTVREPVYSVLADHGERQGVYIIICQNLKLTDDDYDQLSGFVEKGNDVFISAFEFGDIFKKKLKVATDIENVSDEKNGIHFLNKNVGSDTLYNNDKFINDSYFYDIDTAKATIIAQNNFHHAVFFKLKLGKGNLYVNSDPLMFTNYSLLNTKGVMLAGTTLSYLDKNNKTVLWDEYFTQGHANEESVMRVFLNNPSLRWAYYIALFSIVAFVLYQMKRRQRIIPVIEPLSNTSVEFANVVGQVYYEQRNNSNIAQKKIAYFLEYIRTRFYLKTNVLDDNFLNALAQKSGVQRDLLTDLIRQITLLGNSKNVTDNDLISLNQNIELFYTQTG